MILCFDNYHGSQLFFFWTPGYLLIIQVYYFLFRPFNKNIEPLFRATFTQKYTGPHLTQFMSEGRHITTLSIIFVLVSKKLSFYPSSEILYGVENNFLKINDSANFND